MAKSQRGFASMNEERQREIASKGGRAAHEKGTAHEFSTDEARNAGRKGGKAVSRNRDHMAEIGRKGGEAVSRNRDHMADIGREGGQSEKVLNLKNSDTPFIEGAHESKPKEKTASKTQESRRPAAHLKLNEQASHQHAD